MAVIGYHVLHGNPEVVLREKQEYKGKVYPAGSYEVHVNGHYWTGFDRMHPMDGKFREMAWSGVAHGLIAELGVGTVTATTLQLVLAVAALMACLGGSLILLGPDCNGLAALWNSLQKPVHLNQECSRHMEVLPWLSESLQVQTIFRKVLQMF